MRSRLLTLLICVLLAPISVAADERDECAAPVIEFDKIGEDQGRRFACFRLTNPTDKMARYIGPAKNSPSLVFYTPHNLTRKHFNFVEHWTWCGNGGDRIREFKLAPGTSVECRVLLPEKLAPFRLATELFSEPNYTPLINLD